MTTQLTLKQLREIPEAKHVTAINTTGAKTAGIVMDAGLRCLILAADKPANVSLRKHLSAKGVDLKKANQNGFQVARAGALIGSDDKSQPKMKDAPSVSEAAFRACPLQVLFSVSTALNALDRAIEAKKMEAAQLPGHYAKLAKLIVEGKLKVAKDYQKTCKELAGEAKKEKSEPESQIKEVQTADDVLAVLAAVTLKVPDVEWSDETSERFKAVMGALIDAHQSATKPKPKTGRRAAAKKAEVTEPAELLKVA